MNWISSRYKLAVKTSQHWYLCNNEWEHYQFSPLYNDISVLCKLNNTVVTIWWVANIKYTSTGSLKLFEIILYQIWQLGTLIWATPWENLFMTYANDKGADQPAHLRSLISAFLIHCLDSILPLVSKSKISSLYRASVAVQAGLCLTWSQTRKTGFLVTRLIYKDNYVIVLSWSKIAI